MGTIRRQKPRKAPRGRAATSEDILGNGALRRPKRVPGKWRDYYDRLLALREDLLRSQSILSQEAKEETTQYSMHMADTATDGYDRDWALGMLSSEQSALYQVEQALDRIRNGTYGVCELTGRPIEKRRLEAIPWTRFSLRAEKKLESEGGLQRARLGERGSVNLRGETTEPEEEEKGE